MEDAYFRVKVRVLFYHCSDKRYSITWPEEERQTKGTERERATVGPTED